MEYNELKDILTYIKLMSLRDDINLKLSDLLNRFEDKEYIPFKNLNKIFKIDLKTSEMKDITKEINEFEKDYDPISKELKDFIKNGKKWAD